MVVQRRFGPLVAIVFAGLLVLVARLFQVQLLEREVWGREAANLVRSSKIVPYHRGTILDRNGRAIVKDEDVYEVGFNYREFRRGHPLAQVAHARAALEMRAVSLGEAAGNLESWAAELVQLSPADLDAIGKGVVVRRASDLRYYIGELLHVGLKDWRDLRPGVESADRARPYVELVARQRSVSAETLLARVRAEMSASRTHLAFLADLLKQDLKLGGADVSDPLAALIQVLEGYRTDVEDACADALFAEAAGFPPGRVSAATLESAFDVDWIASLLRWDEARKLTWVRTRRENFERELETDALPRILAHAQLEEGEEGRARRILDEIAALYVPSKDDSRRSGDPPAPWQELTDVCVLSELPTLFDLSRSLRPDRVKEPVLALQDPELRALHETPVDPWMLLGMVGELAESSAGAAEAVTSARECAARWQKISPRLSAENSLARAELTRLARALELQHERTCDRAFQSLLVALEPGDSTALAPAFNSARLERALQQEKFIQKDKQSRPVLLRGEVGYALVHLISRYPDRYRGFEVRESTRRVPVAIGADGRLAARLFVGAVRKPSLKQLFAQVDDEKRFEYLKYRVIRSQADEEEMGELAARLYRSDEWTGGFGVEDYFDPELRGHSGYRETEGLQQRESGQEAVIRAAEDGKDLRLTLDLDLQAAAQETLSAPIAPRDEPTDPLWFRNPVGAIVLITPQGEVLAAASEPVKDGLDPAPGRDEERSLARERTLQMPTFQPPGSVFKIFVAAFALDRLRFDPSTTWTCALLSDGGPGYADMHCHSLHGACSLHRALQESCNAYFAHLGELYEPEQLFEMAHTFGFDEPTGIQMLGSDGRQGLREDWSFKHKEAFEEELRQDTGRRRFANGLAMVEATPMQIARATAGLVTGRLPEITIVSSIGGVSVPLRSRELGLSDESREFVKRAMESVVRDEGGTAYNKGLDRSTLSFAFAAKTGSGDYKPFQKSDALSAGDLSDFEAGKMRKHTWVAGWFPVDDPKAILVVYLHDVSKTASHTAVYVAAQFLRSAAVKRFVDGERAVQAAKNGRDDPRAPEESKEAREKSRASDEARPNAEEPR